jgi:hypothetical protein
MRSRHRSAAIAAVLCAVLLSSTAVAVAASAESSPLTPTSRADMLEILTREAADERSRLALRYPSIEIPDMRPVSVVPDDEYRDRAAECLSEFGIEPRVRLSAEPDLNTSALPREVVYRTCQLRFPKQSELHLVLGPFELRRLWAYYVFELQPCLRGIGVDITDSPSFAGYVAARGTPRAWHPYRALTGLQIVRDLDYYDTLCPRVPGWLRP